MYALYSNGSSIDAIQIKLFFGIKLYENARSFPNQKNLSFLL